MAANRPSGRDGTGATVVPLRRLRPCPICGKEAARARAPFCSARCANIDLNRWLTGAYAIPAAGDGDGDDAAGDGED
jgi:hypothetical protein